MYSPITIANYFIEKYGDEGITPMKLVKLVYISHGWYLGMKGKALIDENPEAWKYGPVIPTIYHTFKFYGREQITDISYSFFNETISEEDKKFLDKIWQVYGKFSAIELSAMTHNEGTPWHIVWNNNNYRMYSQIPDNLIKQHYTLKLKRNKDKLNVDAR